MRPIPILVFVLSGLALFPVARAAPPPPAQGAAPYTELPPLVPFYRGSQLQGSLFGQGLQEIPGYLLGTDLAFPYRRKPGAAQEVPLADTFTINHFLGGYPAASYRLLKAMRCHDDDARGCVAQRDYLDRYRKAAGPPRTDAQCARESASEFLADPLCAYDTKALDYAVRAPDGALRFRPELVELRLKPYLDAGYGPGDIVIQLSHMPWDLAKRPAPGAEVADASPPRDPDEWRKAVEHFAGDLKRYLDAYGHGRFGGAAPSFKMGGEYNVGGAPGGNPNGFKGTAEEFCGYYRGAERGVHAVFPAAELMPGEFSGTGGPGRGGGEWGFDVKGFLDRCGTPATVPRSLHASLAAEPGRESKLMPLASARRAVESYARFPRPVAMEIHQFDLLYQPFGTRGGGDEAARRANWEFQTLMDLWAMPSRPRRVYHWTPFVGMGPGHVLLNGSGMVGLVLDHYLGDRPYRLDRVAAVGGAPRSELLAIGFRGGNRSALVLSSFNPSDDGFARARVAVGLPDFLLAGPGGDGGRKFKTVRYRQSDNVFAWIRRDLEAANALDPDYRRCRACLGPPGAMAAGPGGPRGLVAANWAGYQARQLAALRWSQDPDVALKDGTLSVGLEPNELVVVEAQ